MENKLDILQKKIGAEIKIQCLCLPHLEGNLSISTPIIGSVTISVSLPKKNKIPTKDKPRPKSPA